MVCPIRLLLLDIQSCLPRLRTALTPWSETPGLDAQTLLTHVLDRPRAWLLSHSEAALTPLQASALEEVLARLSKGVPLPYVIGHWEFFGLDFVLSPQVLIPRPETEQLVETALTWLRIHPERRRAVDVGSGCGCIAISLAVNVPDLMVIATDVSRPALAVAARNATRNGVYEQVICVQADLLQPVINKFDLICANLPYIPTSSLQDLHVYHQEPILALDGGPDGLSIISRLVENAPGWLAPGGLLLLEIEDSQGVPAYQLSAQVFPQAEITIFPDLAGKDRLLSIQTPA